MGIGTIIRTILVVATCLNTALMATDITGFNNPKLDLVYAIASVILNFVIVACATWYNNDYTQAAAEATGEMRQRKMELKDDYVGEQFFVDEEEEF